MVSRHSASQRGKWDSVIEEIAAQIGPYSDITRLEAFGSHLAAVVGRVPGWGVPAGISTGAAVGTVVAMALALTASDSFNVFRYCAPLVISAIVFLGAVWLGGREPEAGAGRVAQKWRDWQADACFVDNTGGFGAGWIDRLREIGYGPVGIHFAGHPNDMRYANKRAEMWFLMAEWIKDGGALPNLPEMIPELTTPTYTFKGDRVILEDKAVTTEP